LLIALSLRPYRIYYFAKGFKRKGFSDLIEWRSLYEIYEGLLNDIEELKESIRRLCKS